MYQNHVLTQKNKIIQICITFAIIFNNTHMLHTVKFIILSFEIMSKKKEYDNNNVF